MLFESAHLRVTADSGVATLWLGFPGEPVNALDLSRLRELDRAIAAIAENRPLQILVVRSALPGGFCAGLHPRSVASLTSPSARAMFSWYGQEVFERLAALECASVAMIEGPCLGAGFELALACDYRLSVARPETHLGFPGRFACFGGGPRLRVLARRSAWGLIESGSTISAREAQEFGLVDVACCERRAKIELRGFLDRLETRPLKRWQGGELIGLTAERREFARSEPSRAPSTFGLPGGHSSPALPDVMGVLGDDEHAGRIAATAALRGGKVIVGGNLRPVLAQIDSAQARGFVSPLEAEQARARVRCSEHLHDFARAEIVFVAPGLDPLRLLPVISPRAVICAITRESLDDLTRLAFPPSRRVVRLRFETSSRMLVTSDLEMNTQLAPTLAAWVKPYELTPLEAHPRVGSHSHAA